MKCAKCSTELSPTSQFCRSCGTPVSDLQRQFINNEKRSAELTSLYRNGSLNQEQFQEQRQGLIVRTPDGRSWFPGEEPGTWMVWEGQGWNLADPNESLAGEFAQKETASPAEQTPVQQTPPHQQPDPLKETEVVDYQAEPAGPDPSRGDATQMIDEEYVTQLTEESNPVPPEQYAGGQPEQVPPTVVAGAPSSDQDGGWMRPPRLFFLIIAAIVIFALGIAAGVLIFGGDDGDEEQPTDPTVTVEITSIPTAYPAPLEEPAALNSEGVLDQEQVAVSDAPEEEPPPAAPPQPASAVIGEDGGAVEALGGVALIVPPGAFDEPHEVTLVANAPAPSFPQEADMASAGAAVEVILPPGALVDGTLELVIPIELDGSHPADSYTGMRWDGGRWTDAGGVVSGSSLIVRTDQFSTFQPAKVVWPLRPVSFVNEGPFDAVVRPWTFQPFNTNYGHSPLELAVSSFAPGGPGMWPNTSRFMGLPFGVYTFCVEWEDDTGIDALLGDNYRHMILDGPAADMPLHLDENDPIDLAFATEVRFSTDVVGAEEGKCGQTPAGDWNVRLLAGDALKYDVPPEIIAYANKENTPPPEGVTIDNSDGLWRYKNWIALTDPAQWIETTYHGSDPITSVGVRLTGDQNDGWVRVIVDGREVWRGSIFGVDATEEGMFLNYLEVSGLEPGHHTVRAELLGVPGEGGGIHASMQYFGFSTQPVSGVGDGH